MLFSGRHPAENVLLSFSILMAGLSISTILLLFNSSTWVFQRTMQEHSFSTKRISCSLLSSTTGSVIKQPSLPGRIKNMKNAAWRGDGRFDSMCHSAKFGVYTMFCNTILQEVHFELLQVSSVVRIVKLCF